MTPAARLSAAIDVLDQALAGEPVERCLTRWSRASRFAGSKDRVAVRDLVFEALRRRNSYAYAGGGLTGRGVVLGGQLLAGADLAALFSGEGYAPTALTEAEEAGLCPQPSPEDHVRLDYDPSLEGELRQSLGAEFETILLAMRDRGPVDLRVNFIKTDMAGAQSALRTEGIETEILAGCKTALRITQGSRALKGSMPFINGLVELQDVSSQRVAEFADPRAGEKVLDYCTGGGGKTLAMAGISEGNIDLFAFDVNPRRMRDLPERARRAGAEMTICDRDMLVPLRDSCDLVMVDGPCSGSGAWRRTPQQKWALSREKLIEFNAMQDDALDKGATYVRPGGRMIYATCSLFQSENQARVAVFLENHPDWKAEDATQLSPATGGDGFFFIRFFRSVS